jgi:hypothetical protein
MVNMPSRIRFQKKYLAFLTIITVLVTTGLLKTPCPLCDGTGIINSAPAMEHVEIIDYETEEIYVTRTACGPFIVYQYEIRLSLLNNGIEDATGWLKMVHMDTQTEKILDTQYVEVDVPSGTFQTMAYDVWFGAGYETPGRTDVITEVVLGGIPDVVCDGTGKISLNSFLIVDSWKDNFTKIIKEDNPYRPPVQIPWEEYAGEAN